MMKENIKTEWNMETVNPNNYLYIFLNFYRIFHCEFKRSNKQ